MSWFLLNRNLTPLEPYDWKLSRTVLRGERGSNAPDLPGFGLGGVQSTVYATEVSLEEYLCYSTEESREGGTGRAHKGTGRQYRTGYPKACGKETESKQ